VYLDNKLVLLLDMSEQNVTPNQPWYDRPISDADPYKAAFEQYREFVMAQVVNSPPASGEIARTDDTAMIRFSEPINTSNIVIQVANGDPSTVRPIGASLRAGVGVPGLRQLVAYNDRDGVIITKNADNKPLKDMSPAERNAIHPKHYTSLIETFESAQKRSLVTSPSTVRFNPRTGLEVVDYTLQEVINDRYPSSLPPLPQTLGAKITDFAGDHGLLQGIEPGSPLPVSASKFLCAVVDAYGEFVGGNLIKKWREKLGLTIPAGLETYRPHPKETQDETIPPRTIGTSRTASIAEVQSSLAEANRKARGSQEKAIEARQSLEEASDAFRLAGNLIFTKWSTRPDTGTKTMWLALASKLEDRAREYAKRLSVPEEISVYSKNIEKTINRFDKSL
jgi:hypothetical protein